MKMQVKYLLLSIFIFCTLNIWPQGDLVLGLEPKNPLPGSSFFLEGLLENIAPGSIEAVEPLVNGPATFLGCDVLPGDNINSTRIVFRFMATGSGSVEISGLAAKQKHKITSFEKVTIQILEQNGERPIQHGYWRFPAKVYERQSFILSAMNAEGKPIQVTPLSVEGAVLEPDSENPYAFRAAAYRAGKLLLPKLELIDEDRKILIEATEIEILPSENIKAVGGPWQLSLSINGKDFSGAMLVWELEAKGPMQPGLAMPPEIIITSPSGQDFSSQYKLYSKIDKENKYSLIGIRGSFIAEEAGSWEFLPKPFIWLDTDSGEKKQAVTKKQILKLSKSPDQAWQTPQAIIEAAEQALKRLGKTEETVLAIQKGELSALSGSKRFNKYQVLDRAIVILSSSNDPSLRAEAYGVLLRLETFSFYYPGIKKIIKSADAAFGNQRPGELFLWYWIILAIVLLLALIIFIKTGKKTAGVIIALTGFCVLLLLFFVSTNAWRLKKRFVILDGYNYSAPSEQAASVNKVKSGLSGHIVENAGHWLWLECDNGDIFWMKKENIMIY